MHLNLSASVSSNLNIVECKCIDKEIDNTVQDCSNLNIVECKFILLPFCTEVQARSNLNIVECKSLHAKSKSWWRNK